MGLILGAETIPQEFDDAVAEGLATGAPTAGADELFDTGAKTGEPKGAGGAVELSAKEFALLAYFISHPGETLSRDRLLDEVWGYQNYPSTRTVDTHIVHLRQKVEPDPEQPRFIVTVHGSGYKFVE